MFGVAIKKSIPFNLHDLHDEQGQSSVEIIPERGGAINRLKLRGIEVLDGYLNGSEILTNSWMKGMWLAPFPNRIKGGAYQWRQKSYQFPINDPINHHSIHGFLMDEKFPSLQFRKTEKTGILSFHYQHPGAHPAYPFQFELNLQVTLSTNRLEITVTFTNMEAFEIPFGLGWHPYFTLGQPIDELKLTLPPCTLVGTNEEMIPFGKNYPYPLFENSKPIGGEVLDNCFALTNPSSGIASFYLANQKHRLHFWQETGSEGFNYFQIFTPNHRNSIAIEPMSCNIDAFNNGEGLLKAIPQQPYQYKCGVELLDQMDTAKNF
jgi:aldose 1-epimerase